MGLIYGGGGKEREGNYPALVSDKYAIAEIAAVFVVGRRVLSPACPAMMHACHRVVISDNTSFTPPRLEDGCHFRPSLS